MSRSFVDTTLFGGHNTIAKARLARTREAALQQTAGVVAFGDMERIKMSATLPGQGPASAREQRADSLRAMSQARIAQWPNTLEAQRKKKEAVFAERLAAEEALKMAIDKEEETYKAEQRRLAIERANKMLYDQTDRVKALHTRMHMSEIQAVLDEQVAFKERVKERNRSREAMWVAQQKDMLRKMDAEEDARDEEEHARRMEERRLREEQVALKHAEYASKLQTIKREGELMRQKAADDLAAERDMSAARLAAEKAAREESMRLNDFLKDLKKSQAIAVAAEDEKMHRYAIAKEKQLLARRAREEERFDAKQAIKQRMIDAQVERLARMQQTSDTRIERQVEDMENQVRAAERARHQRLRADLIETHMSRQQQLKWKSDAKQQEDLETVHFRSQLGALNERLRNEEFAKTRHTRDERERLDDYLFDQMAQKQALELAERHAEVHEAEHIETFLEDEEAIFQQYAKMCVAELKEEGKSTKPIELLLNKKERLFD